MLKDNSRGKKNRDRAHGWRRGLQKTGCNFKQISSIGLPITLRNLAIAVIWEEHSTQMEKRGQRPKSRSMHGTYKVQQGDQYGKAKRRTVGDEVSKVTSCHITQTL